MLGTELLAQGLEACGQRVRRDLGIKKVHREFKQLAAQKTALHRRRLTLRQEPLARLNLQNPQRRLIAGQGDGHIQRMAGRPTQQFFRGIAPAQPERRLNDRLRRRPPAAAQQQDGLTDQGAEESGHARTLPGSRPHRKSRSRHRGFVLVEATLALSLLTLIGLVMLKLSLNILSPRQWVLQQVLTDAYVTYERAYAERVSFQTLTSSNSPWPLYPTISSSQVNVGALPGGTLVTGTVRRTRMADSNNLPLDSGSGTTTTNPASMKVWKVQSVLTYKVGDRTYAKSRTVIRSQ